MARTGNGRLAANCEALDCLEVMTEVYRALEASARARGLIFTADTSVNLPSVTGERAKLVEALLVLGRHAIAHNADGGWVMLSATPANGSVRFLVREAGKDTCADARVLAEIETTLALARPAVDAMAGEIGWAGKPGTGSTFWIGLPIARDDADTIKTAASHAMPAAAFLILYIEDKIANIELMHTILEDISNARCIDAQTVEEGIALAATLKPDIVITDIHLPDGTGFEVLERLRTAPATAHVPVIALTADAMPTNLANMERHGFDRIVTKPFDVSELVTMVRALLKAA